MRTTHQSTTGSAKVAASQRARSLLERFHAVRAATLALAAPLSDEDCVAQSMTEASPVRWQLAHTTWFFENFVLARAEPDHAAFHPRYGFLFNSYYNAVGERVARPVRGLQTRPSTAEIRDYRRDVDGRVEAWLQRGDVTGELCDTLELGLNHEEQHQELILTDVKHLLSHNPLDPVYVPARPPGDADAAPLRYVRFEEGLRWIGHSGEGFAFDNEGPAHRVWVAAFELASRPVTCGEFLEFVDAGGYRDARWWLSDGWDLVQARKLEAPLYWRRDSLTWTAFTLGGRRPLGPDEPLAHVSFYEADAYARWRGARLPREAEWEVAAAGLSVEGHFVEERAFHPRPTVDAGGDAPAGMFGDVWEWTQSPYVPYPGFRAEPGALGEYNGKFMCNQMVLRGGSCLSPRAHLRASYRNFFFPDARWQMAGLRLARDV